MDKLSKAFQDYKEGYLDVETIADSYCRQYGSSPEEYILECERRKVILYFVEKVLSVLTKYERKLFELYVFDGLTYQEIGDAVGKSKQTVWLNLTRLKNKIIKRIDNEEELSLLRQYITDNPSLLEASTPKEHLGWTIDRLPKTCVGYRWGKTMGKQEWKPIYKCTICEYTDGICTLCGTKCKSRENKRRMNESNSKTVQ
mgnify:CR=1 FL=1